MTNPLNRHDTIKPRHRGRTLAQGQSHRHRSIELLQTIQHAITEVLDREAADLPCQSLERTDRQAVVGAEGEIIIGSGLTEIQPEAQIQSEPLAIAPFMVQDPDVSPKP